MAYGFQVPRQRQRPLTQGAAYAEDQNTQGLATGRFGDVESARSATNRANALRTSQALQATRGTFARSGVDVSPEAAARAQDQAMSAAEAQNLNGTNAVNQLQRQYRSDAADRANQYESAANQREQQGVSNDQFEKTFGANREDAATARNQFGLNYAAGREDANTSRSQFGETMAQRKNEFGVSSGQSQQQIDNQSQQFLQSQAQRDKEFGVTSGQNQQQISNQASQFDKTFGAGREDAADSRSRFDITRGDTNRQFEQTLGQRDKEFGVNSSQNQQQINNQSSQFGQTMGQREREFRTTSGQNQQQIDNQAAQAAAKMGYDYQALSQNDRQFFQKMAQDDTQFGQKLGYDFAALGQNQNQFEAKMGQDQNQFDVTSSQNQQQINNQASQAAAKMGYDYASLNQNERQYFQKLAQDESQFGRTLSQNQNQFDVTRGDKSTGDKYNQIMQIPDAVARNKALKVYYEGGDVGAAISGNIDDKGGLIDKQMSPGSAAYQAKVDELQSMFPNKSPDEINQMVQERYLKADKVQSSILDSGNRMVNREASMENLSRLKPGEKPNPEDLQNIPSVNPASIPKGKFTNDWLRTNNTGGWTNIGGTPYRVIKGGNTTPGSARGDYAIMEDEAGNTAYLMPDGTITDKDPKPVTNTAISGGATTQMRNSRGGR